ncbi:type I secretion system permease/ATPase [Aurantiacibacter aquimixticola]|uniref:ATP-binding cassette domain-containing protein n=1 Tax=Aurantiacibacter aquimixticola TaxID=1958945 RepID=A0A419RTI6_9SPHN|nr:ATP-binding cassette domain-containing protein [Aurantiacibacter aquimixticola]RJY09098.1 ATP-binding cassette domain-containing protein [Aurantiacibacter aquimixticola]
MPEGALVAMDGKQAISDLKKSMRGYFWVAVAFTVILNMLALVAPIYMMQVYDRVLTSGSYDTLMLVTAIALFMLVFFVAAEGGRRRLLASMGRFIGASLDRAVLKAGLSARELLPSQVAARVSDLTRVQSLFVNAVIAPVLDIPFVPMFLLVMFLIHPILGGIGLVGAIILIAIAIVTERMSRDALEDAGKREQGVQADLDHALRQRSAVESMGMNEYVVSAWQSQRLAALDGSLDPQARVNFFIASAKAARQMLQVLILGAGAYLALNQQVSAGAIIAASIIMGRALAPVDQSVGAWKHLIKARQSWGALKEFLIERPDGFAEWRETVPLPRPEPRLSLDQAVVGLPSAEKALLKPASIDLVRGGIIALVGPSGAGKTTVLQTLSGAWPLHDGRILLGNRDIADWASWDRGRYTGYMPQDVELLTGSVFHNISRFTQAKPEDVFGAAHRCGVHEMILSLPMAYDTPVGQNGIHLSAGQRQGIGLARAFFGQPPLVILDEPTAHLDRQRSAAFFDFFARLAKVRPNKRDTTFVIATHDTRMLSIADTIMTIFDRQLVAMSGAEYAAKVRELHAEKEASAMPAETTK